MKPMMESHNAGTIATADGTFQITDRTILSPRLFLFIGIAFGLAWLLWIGAWFSGLSTSNPGFAALATASMFAPSIAALVAIRPVSRVQLSSLGLRFGNWRYYLLTLAILPLLLLAGGLFSILLGIQQLDLNFTILKEMAARSNLSVPEPSILALQIVLPALIIYPLVNMIPALGEEFGWRGFLLDNFMPLGEAKAAVVVGIIWGIWHAPIIAMGWNYPGHSLLGPVLMIVLTVIFGVIFAWLRLRSGSVLVAALAHGALNGQVGALTLFLTKADPLLGAPVGIAVLAPAGIFAAWLILSGRLSSARSTE